VDPHIIKTQLPADEAKIDNKGILSGTITLDNTLIARMQRPWAPTF
jgi:hypothetical protein